jgi:hypothetical protein
MPWVRGPLSGDGGAHDIVNKTNVLIKNIKFDGLKDDRTTWDHYGMKFVYCNNIRLEGIKIVNFNGNGVTFEGTEGKRVSGFSLRRSYIGNNWPKDIKQHCQGLYCQYADNISLNQDIFHQNGGKPGTETAFNHNVYLNAMNGPVQSSENIFSEGSNYGLQQRSGGYSGYNLYVNNAVHQSYGLVNVDSVHPGGVTGIVERSVYYGGKTMNSVHEGWALDLSQISSKAPGVIARDLLFIKDPIKSSAAIQIGACKQPIKNAGDLISPSRFNLKLEDIYIDDSWNHHNVINIKDGAKVNKGANVFKIVKDSGKFTLPNDFIDQAKNTPEKTKQFVLALFDSHGIILP